MNAQCALASCTPMTAESSHRSRWHSHRQEQRNGIVHAAGNVFAEVGYDRANMRMVAERAEVAKPTLYAYFRGKSALLEAVIEYWLDAVPPPALEYMQGENPSLATESGIARTASPSQTSRVTSVRSDGGALQSPAGNPS